MYEVGVDTNKVVKPQWVCVIIKSTIGKYNTKTHEM